MARKERPIPEHLSVDEKSFAKRHRYETCVRDRERGTVENVVDIAKLLDPSQNVPIADATSH